MAVGDVSGPRRSTRSRSKATRVSAQSGHWTHPGLTRQVGLACHRQVNLDGRGVRWFRQVQLRVSYRRLGTRWCWLALLPRGRPRHDNDRHRPSYDPTPGARAGDAINATRRRRALGVRCRKLRSSRTGRSAPHLVSAGLPAGAPSPRSGCSRSLEARRPWLRRPGATTVVGSLIQTRGAVEEGRKRQPRCCTNQLWKPIRSLST